MEPNQSHHDELREKERELQSSPSLYHGWRTFVQWNYALVYFLRGSVRIARLRNLYATDCSRFRRMRRVTHDVFGPRASEEFQPLQEAEAIRLVSELLEDPDSWDEIVKRSFA